MANKYSFNIEASGFDNIKYISYAMESAISLAKKAAKSHSTVLITGESGTGKELFAKALHYESNRRNQPFIAINCSAIPETLFESELFGYEEGTFTGALRGGQIGKFELANKGTLLLDEIGDMPLSMQPKLLRVLQDNKVVRIGGKGYKQVNVRIIASTNNSLEERVKNKLFREDLYYRLNVIPINIPALRERPEDIELLAKYFTHKFADKLSRNVKSIEKSALDKIKAYSWNGNVRELENAIEYAVNMTDENSITVDSLPNKLKKKDLKLKKSEDEEDVIYSFAQLERKELLKALKIYGQKKNSVDNICEALGISRATFYRKVKEYKLISTVTTYE